MKKRWQTIAATAVLALALTGCTDGDGRATPTGDELVAPAE